MNTVRSKLGLMVITLATLTGACASGSTMAEDGMGSANDGMMSSEDGMSTGDKMANGMDMTRTYEVTLENLTNGQPFSPGVLVTHAPTVSLFNVGSRASEGIRMIAEDGNPDAAGAALNGMTGVSAVTAIDMPTHRMGGPGSSSQTWRITADAEATRISLAVMLICTNDGFTGVTSLELPGESGGEVTQDLEAYDAGTEANDETFGSLVDPCGGAGPVMAEADGMNSRNAQTETIQKHGGIRGNGDLDAEKHGWTGPVARLTVRRVM